MKRVLSLGVVLAFFIGAANSAPVLQVTSGILTGASGVDVNGTLYDVEFRDGTCVSLFSGCDALSDFTFTTAASAAAASQALLSQVFVDGALGAFDSTPRLIQGCADNTGQGFCAVFTPTDFLVNNSVAQNSSLEAGDLVRVAFTLSGEDLTIYDTVVYAVWSPRAASVSEPVSAALVLGGLAALGVTRRRLQKRDGLAPGHVQAD